MITNSGPWRPCKGFRDWQEVRRVVLSVPSMLRPGQALQLPVRSITLWREARWLLVLVVLVLHIEQIFEPILYSDVANAVLVFQYFHLKGIRFLC